MSLSNKISQDFGYVYVYAGHDAYISPEKNHNERMEKCSMWVAQNIDFY